MRMTWEREFRLAVVAVVCGSVAACAGGRDDDAGEVMAVRLSPVHVDSIAGSSGGASEASPWALFDRDTQAGWSPHSSGSDGAVRVRVALAAPTAITCLLYTSPSPRDS